MNDFKSFYSLCRYFASAVNFVFSPLASDSTSYITSKDVRVCVELCKNHGNLYEKEITSQYIEAFDLDVVLKKICEVIGNLKKEFRILASFTSEYFEKEVKKCEEVCENFLEFNLDKSGFVLWREDETCKYERIKEFLVFSNRLRLKKCKNVEASIGCNEGVCGENWHISEIICADAEVLANVKHISDACLVLEISCNNLLKAINKALVMILEPTRNKKKLLSLEKMFSKIAEFQSNAKKTSEKLHTYVLLLPKQLQNTNKLCIPLDISILKTQTFEKLKDLANGLKYLADKLEFIIDRSKADFLTRLKCKIKSKNEKKYANSRIFKIYNLKQNVQKSLNSQELIEKIQMLPKSSESEKQYNLNHKYTEILFKIGKFLLEKDFRFEEYTKKNEKEILKRNSVLMRNFTLRSSSTLKNIVSKDCFRFANLKSVLDRTNATLSKCNLIPVNKIKSKPKIENVIDGEIIKNRVSSSLNRSKFTSCSFLKKNNTFIMSLR